MSFIINAFQRCKALANFQTPINGSCVSILFINIRMRNSLTLFQLGVLAQNQQIRNKWPDFRMKKDARKRATLKEYGVYKLRYNTLRKNDIIPLEIQVIKKHKFFYASN